MGRGAQRLDQDTRITNNSDGTKTNSNTKRKSGTRKTPHRGQTPTHPQIRSGPIHPSLHTNTTGIPRAYKAPQTDNIDHTNHTRDMAQIHQPTKPPNHQSLQLRNNHHSHKCQEKHLKKTQSDTPRTHVHGPKRDHTHNIRRTRNTRPQTPPQPNNIPRHPMETRNTHPRTNRHLHKRGLQDQTHSPTRPHRWQTTIRSSLGTGMAARLHNHGQ